MSVSHDEVRALLHRLIIGTRKVPSQNTELGRAKIHAVSEVMFRAQNVAHLRSAVEGFTRGATPADFPLPVELLNALRNSRDPSLDPPPCANCGGVGFAITEARGLSAAEPCPTCRASEETPGPASLDIPTSGRRVHRVGLPDIDQLASQAGFRFDDPGKGAA
jgi:hypothetical protein